MGDLEAEARAWGVESSYWRASGEHIRVPPETVAGVLEALGATDPGTDDGPGPGPARVVVARAGERRTLDGIDASTATLVTEDGRELALAGDGPAELPADLPVGYHELHPGDGSPPWRVIVGPPACTPPPTERAWGWAVQLYGVRSQASWGIGDLADLADLARWSGRELGAGFTMVNPLHAPVPGVPQEPSPYFPSSRRFRNPLYLRVENVPGAPAMGDRLDGLARVGRALNARRLINRDEVWRLKDEALRAIWAQSEGQSSDRGGFEPWRVAAGPALDAFATFCALSEDLGRPWQAWPERFRHPGSTEVAAYRAAHPQRVGYHAWLQWLLDGQLSSAEGYGPVVHDLAVGFDPGGADAWCDQDIAVPSMSVGAPPDELNTQGQDWGVPPFDPWKLRAAGYQPFIDTLRSVMRRGGGVRIDHVMGLFRQFWIPRGGGAAAGTYVRFPARELLEIVALESVRAGAFVIGEDLGTVEPGVREDLAARGVLSYRLLWFDGEPGRWPHGSMAAVTTHDLPTVAGMWTGTDLRAQHAAGVSPSDHAAAEVRRRVEGVAGVTPDATVSEVTGAVYEALGRSPSRLRAATLEDALGVEERPNMPGTVDEWPNWRLALPEPLEAVMDHPGTRRIAAALTAGHEAPR